MKKVLIGGIGNVLLEDDGVGPYVARLLAHAMSSARASKSAT
jgi:Ni,Fe-hydrogenase maturation factor